MAMAACAADRVDCSAGIASLARERYVAMPCPVSRDASHSHAASRVPCAYVRIAALAWHPFHEELFAAGGHEGSLQYWSALLDAPLEEVEPPGPGYPAAHEGAVWQIAWHPLGHLVATASNDHTTKFWSRQRPGDKMRSLPRACPERPGGPRFSRNYGGAEGRGAAPAPSSVPMLMTMGSPHGERRPASTAVHSPFHGSMPPGPSFVSAGSSAPPGLNPNQNAAERFMHTLDL
jgi:WD40 repeat protein